ncbi:MAG: hypothetical protein KDI13_01245 [Alphaproteobacteria bacterium]|nr:hypothetical protein [Alphaproteobacteria bacterium]
MRILKIFLFLTATILFTAPAHAATLDEETVKEYLQETINLYNAETVDHGKISDFTRKHYSPDIRVVLKVQNNISAIEPKEIILTRSDILASNDNPPALFQNSRAKIEMTEFEPEDGQVWVTYKFLINATLQGTRSDGTIAHSPYINESSCKDRMGLENDIIIVYESLCETHEKIGDAN